MSLNPSRRGFLAGALAAGASPAVWGLAAPAGKPAIQPQPGSNKLTTYPVGPQIWIRWADNPVTCCRAHPTQKYPSLYPLSGPVSGLSLTTESGSSYPHHRSLLFACDRVNGGNYWQGDVDAGQIVSQGPKLGTCTPESAEILDECGWHKPGEAAVMRDQRQFKISIAGPRLRMIDAAITWTAVADVTVLKTNHSLFALRAARDITPWGGGTLVNSQGQEARKPRSGKKRPGALISARDKEIPTWSKGSPCWITRATRGRPRNGSPATMASSLPRP